MSDPVTNIEIEDVLSSIRRLVSDGDQTRALDHRHSQQNIKVAHPVPASVDVNKTKTDKFILTPALMVVEADVPELEIEEGTDNGWSRTETLAAKPEDAAPVGSVPEDDQADSGPLELTNRVWDPVSDASVDEKPSILTALDSPDRSELVATIAELEAAVDSEAGDFEPDGTEVFGHNIAWPGATARGFKDIEEAKLKRLSVEELNAAAKYADDSQSSLTKHATDQTTDVSNKTAFVPEPVFAHQERSGDAVRDHEDEDLGGSLDEVSAGGLDEDALRLLVSEVVREELNGPLGERVTRNVRKLVRREIYRILSSKEFD